MNTNLTDFATNPTHPKQTAAYASLLQFAEWERTQPPSPAGYFGPHDYLARHGKVFESQPLTAAETAYLKNALAKHRGERFPLGNCFENALRLSRRTPGLNYVVGVATVSRGVLAPHAWVSLNGKVIDLTCLKTWNPYRSHLLDRTDRRSGRDTTRDSRVSRRLGVFGEIPPGWLFVGEEFVDHTSAMVFECTVGFHGTALRSKWYSSDPLCQRGMPW